MCRSINRAQKGERERVVHNEAHWLHGRAYVCLYLCRFDPALLFFFFFIKTSRVRSLERAEPYKEEGNNKTAKEEEKGVAEVMAGLHGSNLPPLFLLLVCSWASDNGLARAVDVLHIDRPEGSALTSPWVP